MFNPKLLSVKRRYFLEKNVAYVTLSDDSEVSEVCRIVAFHAIMSNILQLISSLKPWAGSFS